MWRRVAQKARKKEGRHRRKEEKEDAEEEEVNGGCEAAVKRGRVRVGPSQLAGRVDADRESKGWVDGRGKEDKAGDGASVGVGRGARREGGGRERIGENRARLGFAMTNGRRGHSARRSYRSKRDYHVGLSVECLSRPGHLIRPRRGSFVFLVFQTRAAPRRATPYFPFVRAIYRPPSPPGVPPFLYRPFAS